MESKSSQSYGWTVTGVVGLGGGGKRGEVEAGESVGCTGIERLEVIRMERKAGKNE